MIALNRKEIRQKSLNFWVQFGILVCGILLVVYVFIWSSVQEHRKYLSLLQEYKQIENSQIRIRYKADSLYWYVSRLALNRTSDEKFLVANIRDQKHTLYRMAVADSMGHFKGYEAVTRHLDAQLAIRDTIIAVEKANTDLRHDFEACRAKDGRLKNALQQLQ